MLEIKQVRNGVSFALEEGCCIVRIPMERRERAHDARDAGNDDGFAGTHAHAGVKS